MASLSRSGSSILPSLRRANHLSHQTRCFSKTTTWHDAVRGPKVDVSKMAPKQKSMQSRMKNLKRSEIPDDVGILPATLVRPTYKEVTEAKHTSRQYLTLQWACFKQTVQDLIALVYLYKWRAKGRDGKRMKAPLYKHERIAVAQRLHQTLYKAIAEADASTISKVALRGLAQQQLARIESRRIADLPPESWTVEYNGTMPPSWLPTFLQPLWPAKAVKIVADRQTNLPFGELVSCRQFIARIHSTQTRNRNDGSAPVTKQVTEYLVVQRFIIDLEFEEWKVWGTTKSSTIEEAEEIASMSKSENGSTWDQIKDRFRDKVPFSS